MTKRIVLAYSGGLDTSVAIGWITEQTGAEVIALAVDVGQGGEDLGTIRQRALDCGATESVVADARAEFAAGYCLPALRANALYQQRYPLVSALSRPLIVSHLAAVAREYGATMVSHGCTGKGNDQVRFEAGLAALAPGVSVFAPVRDSGMTRDKAIAFAAEKGLPIEVTAKSPYSIDQNLWGRSCETGHLEDIWEAPHDDVWGYTSDPAQPQPADEVTISFADGLPVALDGRPLSPLELITELHTRAGRQGVGRIDMVEDRLVGIKSREIYEVPAAALLLTAYAGVEELVCERDLAHTKQGLALQYATLVYNGLWFSPLRSALQAFMDETTPPVTGTAKVKLYRGSCAVVGRKAASSLYDHALATYEEGDAFQHGAAAGFIHVWSLPTKTWAAASSAADTVGV